MKVILLKDVESVGSAGEVVQEAGGASSVFGIVMNADGRLRVSDAGGNEVKQIGQYEAFGIGALDVTHENSRDGDCTITVSSEGPCTCVVVRRSQGMLQQMRGVQKLARVSLFHAVEGHDSHVVGTCLAGNHDDPDSTVRMDELERRMGEQNALLARLVTGNSNLWQYVTGATPPSPEAIPQTASHFPGCVGPPGEAKMRRDRHGGGGAEWFTDI